MLSPQAAARSWHSTSGCVLRGSPELIQTPQLTLTPTHSSETRAPSPASAGAATYFPLSQRPWTPLSPEGVWAEGGSVAAGPVEEAKGWVYPGRQPRKPEHVIKRFYLPGSAFWDKSSQCSLRLVTSVWALPPLLPGSVLSL